MKERLWDLPTRLFHWTLVLLVGLSWWSAEEQKLQLHLWLGYAVVFLIAFRILWGFLGSSTARFSSFAVGPRSVVQYLRAGFRWPIAGHAPLGALSVVALLVLLVVQVGSGLVASDEDGLFTGSLSHLVSISTSEAATELHEEVFDILLVFIGLHVAAILFYRLVLGRRLVGPMITGRADLPRGMEPMRPATPIVAAVCAILALAVTGWIYVGAPPLGT